MSVDINISLATRNQPTVNLTIGDDAQNLIIGTNNTAPIITSVLTGPPGPSGAAGTPDIGIGEITSSMLDDGIVTDSKLATNSVTTNKILASCITSSKLNNNAVTTSKIANNAVTAAKIAPGAITEELNGIFADGSLTGNKIKDGDISNVKIQNEAITAPKLAANSVVTAKIINGAITGAKLENDIIIPGAKINGMFQLLGNSPAYLLGPTQDDLHIQSEAGLIFKVDHDNNSNNTFKFRNGSNSDVITIDESGNVTITGNIIVNGTVDGVDVSSLPTTDTNTQLPLLDEDDMASNSSLSVPSQQSVKAYVDSKTHLELGTTSTTALAGDTTTISTAQANAIIANTAKVSFPGLGTTSTTALAGDTTTISGSQASAIIANTAKVGITTSQADAITANTAKNSYPTADATKLSGIATGATANVGDVTLTGTQTISGNKTLNNLRIQNEESDGTPDIRFYEGSDNGTNYATLKAADSIASNYEVSLPTSAGTIQLQPSEGAFANGDKTKLDSISAGAEVNVQSDWNATSGDAQILNKPTIPAAYTDSDAVSAVAAADNYLKNDTDEVLDGSLTIEHSLFVQRSDGGNTTKTKLVNNSTTGNKTLDVPDASGVLALTNSLIDFKVASYWSSSTAGFYVPLSGATLNETTVLSTASYSTMLVVPYDGKIKRISAFHQNTTSGTATLKLYIDGDDNPTTDNRGDTMSVSSYTNKWTQDCPANWTFSKGETIAIFRTDSTAKYGVTMTVVLEYDTTT